MRETPIKQPVRRTLTPTHSNYVSEIELPHFANFTLYCKPSRKTESITMANRPQREAPFLPSRSRRNGGDSKTDALRTSASASSTPSLVTVDEPLSQSSRLEFSARSASRTGPEETASSFFYNIDGSSIKDGPHHSKSRKSKKQVGILAKFLAKSKKNSTQNSLRDLEESLERDDEASQGIPDTASILSSSILTVKTAKSVKSSADLSRDANQILGTFRQQREARYRKKQRQKDLARQSLMTPESKDRSHQVVGSVLVFSSPGSGKKINSHCPGAANNQYLKPIQDRSRASTGTPPPKKNQSDPMMRPISPSTNWSRAVSPYGKRKVKICLKGRSTTDTLPTINLMSSSPKIVRRQKKLPFSSTSKDETSLGQRKKTSSPVRERLGLLQDLEGSTNLCREAALVPFRVPEHERSPHDRFGPCLRVPLKEEDDNSIDNGVTRSVPKGVGAFLSEVSPSASSFDTWTDRSVMSDTVYSTGARTTWMSMTSSTNNSSLMDESLPSYKSTGVDSHPDIDLHFPDCEKQYITAAPGINEPLRGAKETMHYVLCGRVIGTDCSSCNASLNCVDDGKSGRFWAFNANLDGALLTLQS